MRNALKMLITTYIKIKTIDDSCGIVVGSACDPHSKKLTYGGYKHPRDKYPIKPTNVAQPCKAMNGNIVLNKK